MQFIYVDRLGVGVRTLLMMVLLRIGIDSVQFGKVGLGVFQATRRVGRSYLADEITQPLVRLKVSGKVVFQHALEEGPNGPGDRAGITPSLSVEYEQRREVFQIAALRLRLDITFPDNRGIPRFAHLKRLDIGTRRRAFIGEQFQEEWVMRQHDDLLRTVRKPLDELLSASPSEPVQAGEWVIEYDDFLADFRILLQHSEEES